MSLNEILSQDVALNVTTILLLIQQLAPDERKVLFTHLGVSGEKDLLELFAPSDDQKPDVSYEEQLLQYEDYRAHKILTLYAPPVILIIGTIGNLLTFLILMQRPMRKYSTYIYLAVLSVTDTLVLYIGLLRLWVAEISGYDIRDADWACKVVNVVGYTVSNFSVWLIIAVTVERYIAVCHPLKAPSMCNRRRALVVIGSLLALLLAINLHFFWTAAVVRYRHHGEMITQCAGASNSKTLVVDIWPWVDAIIYSFLPFGAISVFNILIIHQVIRARRKRSQLQSSSVYCEQRHARHQQESSYKMTVMLLTISFTFLLTTLPVNVSLIATAFWNSYAADLEMVAKFTLVRTITELLMYMNHSINFFLYCATGQKFRQQLFLLLCRRFSRHHGLEFRHNISQTQQTRLTENCNGRTQSVHSRINAEMVSLKDMRGAEPSPDRKSCHTVFSYPSKKKKHNSSDKEKNNSSEKKKLKCINHVDTH